MVRTEAPASPEDGFIAEITEILNSKKLPFNVTDLVKKYLASSTLLRLNDAIRFCCTKGMSRPRVVIEEDDKYMLISH